MTPIISPIWFYLMDVCGDLNNVLIAVCVAVAVVVIICLVLYVNEVDTYWRHENDERVKKAFLRVKKAIAAFIIALLTIPIVPNEDTLLKMLIAKTVTYENVESAKHEATDLVDYIIEKVDTLMDDKTTESGEENG